MKLGRNDVNHLLRRLARRHPEIMSRWERGEFILYRLMSDSEAVLFVAIVAITVALAVMVG